MEDPEILQNIADATECCDTCCGRRIPKELSYILKAVSEACGIAFETYILVDRIMPRYRKVNGELLPDVSMPKNENDYKHAANSYIAFYAIGLIAVVAYWVIAYVNKSTVPGLAILMTFTCEMPLMVSEMCLLKAEGEINWDGQLPDLVLQICFLINVFIQIYFDVWRLWDDQDIECLCILGHIFILGIDFVITCILYAPVMWAMAGWHWFERIRMSHIKGIITSEHSANALEILMLIGHIGQWVIGLVIVIFVGWFACKLICGDSSVDPE